MSTSWVPASGIEVNQIVLCLPKSAIIEPKERLEKDPRAGVCGRTAEAPGVARAVAELLVELERGLFGLKHAARFLYLASLSLSLSMSAVASHFAIIFSLFFVAMLQAFNPIRTKTRKITALEEIIE